MNYSNRKPSFQGRRFLSIAALLFACLLFSNCPGGGNDNNANTNGNAANANAANTSANANANTNATSANVNANANTSAGAKVGVFCKEQTLKDYSSRNFKREDAAPTSCVTARHQTVAPRRELSASSITAVIEKPPARAQ
jgi:hypothetical protein